MYAFAVFIALVIAFPLAYSLKGDLDILLILDDNSIVCSHYNSYISEELRGISDRLANLDKRGIRYAAILKQDCHSQVLPFTTNVDDIINFVQKVNCITRKYDRAATLKAEQYEKLKLFHRTKLLGTNMVANYPNGINPTKPIKIRDNYEYKELEEEKLPKFIKRRADIEVLPLFLDRVPDEDLKIKREATEEEIRDHIPYVGEKTRAIRGKFVKSHKEHNEYYPECGSQNLDDYIYSPEYGIDFNIMDKIKALEWSKDGGIKTIVMAHRKTNDYPYLTNIELINANKNDFEMGKYFIENGISIINFEKKPSSVACEVFEGRRVLYKDNPEKLSKTFDDIKHFEISEPFRHEDKNTGSCLVECLGEYIKRYKLRINADQFQPKKDNPPKKRLRLRDDVDRNQPLSILDDTEDRDQTYSVPNLHFTRKSPPNIFTFGDYDVFKNLFQSKKTNIREGKSATNQEVSQVLKNKVENTSYLVVNPNSITQCIGLVYANKFLSHAYNVANYYAETNYKNMTLGELTNKTLYVEPVYILSAAQAAFCTVFPDKNSVLKYRYASEKVSECPYVFMVMKAVHDGFDDNLGIPMFRIEMEFIQNACVDTQLRYWLPPNGCVQPDPYMMPFGLRSDLSHMRVVNLMDIIKSDDNENNLNRSFKIDDHNAEPDDFYIYECQAKKCKNYFLSLIGEESYSPEVTKNECPTDGIVIPESYSDFNIKPFSQATKEEILEITQEDNGHNLYSMQYSKKITARTRKSRNEDDLFDEFYDPVILHGLNHYSSQLDFSDLDKSELTDYYPPFVGIEGRRELAHIKDYSSKMMSINFPSCKRRQWQLRSLLSGFADEEKQVERTEYHTYRDNDEDFPKSYYPEYSVGDEIVDNFVN